jgi:hypothetical protein
LPCLVLCCLILSCYCVVVVLSVLALVGPGPDPAGVGLVSLGVSWFVHVELIWIGGWVLT